MRLLPALVTGALAASLLVPATVQAMPQPDGSARVVVDGSRARPAGRWVLDPAGRVLVLHGLNMVYKRAPYAPDRVGFGADDAAFLARNGFTTVRLGLIWKAVEPKPGQYDDAYLARIRRTTEVLASKGIWTLLDFHQDLFNERFQGEGAPDWAVQDDGLPAQPQLGFPDNYFVQASLNRAFDHFWANDPGPGGVGLQDRYAAAWRHVATYFRHTPRVLGVDLFNEPWPGSAFATCANPLGCPLFDQQLQAFSQRSIDAIRSVDGRTAIFYEPNVIFNDGAQTAVTPTGKRLGFSFHDYCLTADTIGSEAGFGSQVCDGFDGIVWQNMADHVAASGDAPLLTEFGATNDQTTLRGMVDRAASYRTGWQYWAYCGCADPTTTGPGTTQALVFDPAKAPRGTNVDWAKMRAIVTPHPLAVSGTPTRWHFDRTTRVFSTSWSPKRAGGAGAFAPGSRTTIAVPPLAYPKGCRVTVTGGRVVSAAGARVLVIAQAAGASRVRVVVRPAG
jgi:endoglycosylceramidase